VDNFFLCRKEEFLMETRLRTWFWTAAAATGLTLLALPVLVVAKQASLGRVAVVNESAITQEDFERELGLVQRRFARMGRPLSDSQLLMLKKRVLESLINRELLYQESQDEGIKIEDHAINEELKAVKSRFSNEEEFKAVLISLNLSEAGMKAQIERDLAIKQLVDNQFVQKVKVSGKETKAFYESHPESFKRPEEVRASHILIKVDPEADESQKAAALNMIGRIQNKVKKGEDFAALAKEFSQGPSGSKGGDVGFIGRGQTVKPFEEAAFALKPGEVSNIVQTKFGYHLIKVTEQKPATTIGYEDVKDKLKEYLKEQKVQQQLDLLIEELKGRAKVERYLGETSN
jgi:peptidyl-prolyl cis-trans isomerase C